MWLKLINFCTAKKTTNKMKRTCGLGENICKWCDQLGLNFQSMYTNNSYNSEHKKANNLIKKWAEDLDISPKNISIWIINAWKNSQHCLLLEKCKSKLQWSKTSHKSEWPSS